MATDEAKASKACIDDLCERIRHAGSTGTALAIQGGGTKTFYAEACAGEPIGATELVGVSSYDPTELVVTVAAGTRLRVLIETLADAGQMLPFEPPAFGEDATVGGTVACGISGPRRPWAGSVRDYVLGVDMITGRGEHLAFGGQVMKNVAGYDVSRLVTGALGTLGLITSVSFKVLPMPKAARTLVFECDADTALARAVQWARRPLPLSAIAWCDGVLSVRIEGAESAVSSCATELGGDPGDHGVWTGLREQTHRFFTSAPGQTLWRISLPQGTPVLDSGGQQLVEWGGAQRWVIDAASDGDELRALAAAHGGHATAFRNPGESGSSVFTPLPPVLMRLHRNLKQTFDPNGILNPGRMYPGV